MCNDVLRNAAAAFESLLKYKYRIVLGRKSTTEQLDICFLPETFFHLAGLHYLKKSYFFRSFSAEKIFHSILDNSITQSDIQDDKSFNFISKRLMVLEKLDCILEDSNLEFFKYEKNKTKNNSKIKADYLSKSVVNGVSFVFFLKEKNKDFYIANSTFPMESYDYSLGQVKYALLFKEKINLRENTSEIIFQHKKYMPDCDIMNPDNSRKDKIQNEQDI